MDAPQGPRPQARSAPVSTVPDELEPGWPDPVIERDEGPDGSRVDGLLRAARAGGEALFVMGLGFDPRCATGLSRYVSATGSVPRVAALRLNGSTADAPAFLDGRRAANAETVRALAGPRLSERPYPTLREPAGVGRAAAQDLAGSGLLDGVGQVVVDASALPTPVVLPLVKMLLDRCAERLGSPELQLLVVENPDLDAEITEQGVAGAAALPGFRAGALAKARLAGQVCAWAPVLGEGAGPALARVAAFLEPDEVNPVLPFPATDPRRADRLFLEHRELLVEQYRVSAGGVLYADERNPFDLAAALVRWHDDTTRALVPLGVPPLVCLSAHSSKLLSIGVLLAAYQREMPIVATRATGYDLGEEAYDESRRDKDRTAVVWLRGDPYRVTPSGPPVGPG